MYESPTNDDPGQIFTSICAYEAETLSGGLCVEVNMYESLIGWRRLIGCLKLQIIFAKEPLITGLFCEKMIYEDKASYVCTPPCTNDYSLQFLRLSVIMKPKPFLEAYVYIQICMRVLQPTSHYRVFTSICEYDAEILSKGLRGEVGGWGRDPKKCTGRDWGMGSSTI